MLAAACSSASNDDSGSSTPTSAAEAVTTAIAPAPTETPLPEPSGNITEAQDLPPAPAAETTTTASSTSTTSTTTSAATTSAASAPSEEPGTSEPTGTTSSTTTAAPPAATSTTTTTSSTTTTTAPVVAREQAGLRPRQRNDVALPLPADIPRDRYVPGLAAVNIYSQINDQGSLDLQAKLDELAIFMRYVGNYQPYPGATAANRDTNGTFREVAKLIEDTLLWMGFTPQNVCGAPAGYSFTDLLQPTREWSEELKVYSGDAIFTTDRLLELHGGERINPEANLDFYIRQAVQTAYDSLRLAELSDEIEAPQMILCDAWKLPSGEIPEAANGYWYALLTPGIQPRESLMSQGTYHLKEISRNGNRVQIVVCHPTLGSRYIAVWWRDAGYRAEATGSTSLIGCQAEFEQDDYISEHEDEPSFTFSFGERVFSASDLLGFPRS